MTVLLHQLCEGDRTTNGSEHEDGGGHVNGDFAFEDMTDETKAMAVRLYGVLISYLRGRPLKLAPRMKEENGFEAWQGLLRETQQVSRARALALLTQLSRVQFADWKTISEQLPQYETIVTEYERISGHTYADDAKVAAILQAVPPHLRAHLQLWITDGATYEQVKNKVMELEALSTRWDSSNSLSLPTRSGIDEATPMEVDQIRDKGKKGGKGKSKGTKGKAKRKDKGGKSQRQKDEDPGKEVRKDRANGRRVALARKAKVLTEEAKGRLEHATTVAKWGILQKTVGPRGQMSTRWRTRVLRPRAIQVEQVHHAQDTLDKRRRQLQSRWFDWRCPPNPDHWKSLT